MQSTVVMVVVLVVAPSVVAAEPQTMAGPELTAEQRWPRCPDGHALSLEDQITERFTQLGNLLGKHLDLLTNDMFQLKVDARQRHARIRIHGGDGQGMIVRLDSDIQLDDVRARISTRVDLGYQDHVLRFELPDVELAPTEYRGDYGVELRLPVFAMSF